MWMRKIIQLIARCFLYFLIIPSVWGIEGNWVHRESVSMRLVLPADGIVSNEPFWIGWEIVRKKGWHTYWMHPGDVGVPPNLDWHLDGNFRVESLILPTPVRVDMSGIRASGHVGSSFFIQKIHPPDLKGVHSIALRAKASWLACSDVCLPGRADLDLEVPVKKKTIDDQKWQKKIKLLLESLPKPLPAEWKGSVREIGKFYEVNFICPTTWSNRYIDFFGENRMVRSNYSPKFNVSEDGFSLLMEKAPWRPPESARFEGLLAFRDETGSPLFYRIDLPVN
jgi:DsbC/DsbD-like thiol-disulfide interchange protein